ncbi:MAG: hypothetical protein ACE5HF_09780 [Gemmatimonadota bacterium]
MFPSPSPSDPPEGWLFGLWEDESGLLWTVGQTADPEWRGGLGPGTTIEGREVYPVEDPERVYDAVIEVLDPEAEPPVLHSRRLPRPLFFLLGSGALATVRETDLGFRRIDLWGASLSGSEAAVEPPVGPS